MAISDKCHVLTVVGGKGGVGKSVFAANLSFALLKEMRARTLLIDLDSKTCGDQNILTGLRPLKTIAEVCNFTSALTPQSLKTLITQHQTGLSFIGGVHSPDQTLSLSASIFSKQLEKLSQFFQFIVIDCGNEITDLQMKAIDVSSSVLLVSTPEVLALNQTKRMMNQLMASMVPADFIQIVLNKVGNGSLNPQTISQNLKRPIIGSIPQDEATTLSALQRSIPFVVSQPNTPISSAHHDVARKLTGGLIQSLKAKIQSKPTPPKTAVAANALPGPGVSNSDLDTTTLLKLQIHSELVKDAELKKEISDAKGDPNLEKDLRDKTAKVIAQLTDTLGQGLNREERGSIIKQVLDEALGLGALEELLEDRDVSEIMVNGANQIFVERSGKLTLSDIKFTSNTQLRNVIERIVVPLGRQINEKTPYVDARLKDGSRVNAVIEPLALDGPALTIRKFPADRITIKDYTDRFNSLTKPMADFLKICVEQGLNVIISGGTGSGKTTLLNVLSGFIPETERIITVEDAAELQLKQAHVVRLETRPANMEGTGEITIRDLIRNSLRMRPDRIVVGECRDGAALDMLSAMNTGHDGSMATVHSNNPREAIARLETLCLMAGMDLPAKAIREQIASAVNLIIQISRFSDGTRKIASITEVCGMQSDTVTLNEIFYFKEESLDKNRKIVGTFKATGRNPQFLEKFKQRGVNIPLSIFATQETQKPQATPPPPKKVSGGN